MWTPQENLMSLLDQLEDLLMVSSCLLLFRIRFALLKQGRMYNDIIWTDVVGFFQPILSGYFSLF